MILFRIALKIRETKETASRKETWKKLGDYVSNRYGSWYAFLLLKHFLEFKLARERKGFTIFEVGLNIAPSMVLTRQTLVKIGCLADGAQQGDADKGLDLLIRKGIIAVDSETDILDLRVPIDSVANLCLKETKQGLELVKHETMASIVLLSTNSTEVSSRTKGNLRANVSAVPSILFRKKGRSSLMEIAFAQDATHFRA
jgi:hypothetical protein